MVYEMECQPARESIGIIVNGEARTVHAGQTISGLLEELGLAPERVAVELDRLIVKRPEWASRELGSGSQLEIVQFVGGG
jgi:thiamine biosynthesis protein ThiS